MKPDEEEVKTELRKTTVSSCNVQGMDLIESLIKGCSKYSKMVRVVGWIYRFMTNCKNVKNRTT